MTTIIKDGSGSGHAAKVDCYNRLKTQSTIVTLEHFSNIHDGQAYSMVFAQTPEAGARFVVIQNLSSHNMVIEGVIWAQSDEKIGVGIGSLGIPLDVTSVEPTNLNAGSNNSAIGVFGVGTNITGLTGGCNVTNYRLKGNDSSKWFWTGYSFLAI